MTSLAPRVRTRGLAVLGLFLAAAFVRWEIVTPRLPVQFETVTTPMWAARLVMAALSAAGIAAVFVGLARVEDRRSGAYAAAILATTPAWFVHGRTSTGGIVPMAAEAVILAGLTVAMLAERARTRSRVIALGVVLACATAAAATLGGLAAFAAPPAIALGFVAAKTRAGRTALVLGLVLAGLAAVFVATSSDGTLARIVAGPRTGSGHATFDAPVTAIAYALLPWTPLVPIALARRPRTDAHRAMALTAVLAIGVHALLAPRTGPSVFVGVAPIACAVALALRDLEEARRPAVALVGVVVVTGILVGRDVDLGPDRIAAALGAHDLTVTSAELAQIARTARSATWLSVSLGATALAVPRTWLPTGRGLAVLAAGALAGLVLRTYAYPSLLARLSPGEAFEAYWSRHAKGEPLGLLGVPPRSIAVAEHADVVPLANAESSVEWLLAAGPSGPRRFLAFASAELARVNGAFRATRGHNVPVLAGEGGSVLLAASALVPGEPSVSPLDRLVLDAPPPELRPLGAKLGDRLEAIGWQITDDHGRALVAVPAGKKAHVRVAVRVLAGEGPLNAYCTFIHVDHQPTRFSAEHRQHTYPMSLWRDGDVVIDDFEVKLPPHFVAGRYPIFWGVGVLPCDDDRRMPVTSGPADDHQRVRAGLLEVR